MGKMLLAMENSLQGKQKQKAYIEEEEKKKTFLRKDIIYDAEKFILI